MSKKLKIKLANSWIGHPKYQRATLQALGLRRLNQVVIHEDSPPVRGMIRKVAHLVRIEDYIAEEGNQIQHETT